MNNALRKYIVTICLFFLVFSCSPRDILNEAFEETYGKEIQKIRKSRTPPAVAKGDKNRKLDFAPYVPQKNTKKADDAYVSHEQYYANVDATEYANTKPRETFPDKQVFEAGKNSQTLPDKMFRISYNTNITPPFKRVGYRFDRIKIPPKDSYGIVTAASHKQYFLVGNKSLQDNVDHIKAHRTQEDIELSNVLIKEHKDIKRRLKNMKVFGKDIGLEPEEIVVEVDEDTQDKNDDIAQVDDSTKLVKDDQ